MAPLVLIVCLSGCVAVLAIIATQLRSIPPERQSPEEQDPEYQAARRGCLLVFTPITLGLAVILGGSCYNSIGCRRMRLEIAYEHATSEAE